MPRQAGPVYFIGEFNGKIGNIYYFRKMPEKVNQTTETKRASGNFGIAPHYNL